MHQHVMVPQGGQKIGVHADFRSNVPVPPTIPAVDLIISSMKKAVR